MYVGEMKGVPFPVKRMIDYGSVSGRERERERKKRIDTKEGLSVCIARTYLSTQVPYDYLLIYLEPMEVTALVDVPASRIKQHNAHASPVQLFILSTYPILYYPILISKTQTSEI